MTVPAAHIVTVADQLFCPDRPPIDCPAGALVAGELRRRGVPTQLGPLRLTGPGSHPDALASVLSGADGPIGLGVAPALGKARAVLLGWLAVADRPRSVLLAAPRSFCAGVDRAIEVVEQALAQRGSPVYVRKQIVHNTHVVNDLRARGAVFVEELAEVPDGACVVFSAHGVSPAVRADAARRGLAVIDATCPLVTKVHVEARRYAARGDTVVLIGHAGHEEVDGTLGEAPEHTVLVQSAAEVADLRVDDPARVSYLTQTTLAVDETAEVVAALRARFPKLRGPASEDICYATTNRQDALDAIAAESDLVLVVGSTNSSNSRRLVELAHRRDTSAYLIDDVADIRPEWLAGVSVVGLTAGASAPPGLVDEVVAALGGLGSVTVTERETTRETIRFSLPSAVRPPGARTPEAQTSDAGTP
ncbi:4-hydroxy-3-methylbut-2-enyl diphosphate reductase [Solihabitans fulvus]|uniref:4-hydroxy-3-methylbut-2-enyl diphosphate reductase n=1 Tax=Solihabitans fulvus TaxID=1892852 RepID=A0A5B2XRV3_9PSEU|nr:4-hydroxy-3-methylbut-2-enyl diphosphate reductase [Solihabitans fulvus]KAA2265672.1 4-hydroxy-3-methylbut-2-enyl diphosphate reductase [Solihabitans fulvus]